MATVTETVTLEVIGEHLREARQDIHGLKTDIMKLGDDLRTEFGERFDGLDGRLDGIDASLAKITEHLGSLKFRVLTQAEHDALNPPDPSTLYFISGDK